MALGKNPLIGFMTWEGYNYEDAVLLSERLVQEGCLFAKDSAEQPFLSRQLSLAFRGHFPYKDISCAHFSADPDDGRRLHICAY